MLVVAPDLAVLGCIGCAKDDIKKGWLVDDEPDRLHDDGGGPVAGYPFAIFHLLTHGFFQGRPLPQRRPVMHAMNDDGTCGTTACSARRCR